MNPKSMTKYICPECKTIQIKQPIENLIIRVECYKCGHTQLLTNILGSK